MLFVKWYSDIPPCLPGSGGYLYSLDGEVWQQASYETLHALTEGRIVHWLPRSTQVQP